MVEEEVEIVSRIETVIFPRITQPLPIVMITYVTKTLPPATVQIEKKAYSPEEERKRIHADIAKRLEVKPEELKLKFV